MMEIHNSYYHQHQQLLSSVTRHTYKVLYSVVVYSGYPKMKYQLLNTC